MLKNSDVSFNEIFGDKNEEDTKKKSDITYTSVFEDTTKNEDKDCDFTVSHAEEVYTFKHKLNIVNLD